MNLTDYRTLRTAAGFIELADRGWLAVAGRDRADFLQGLLTNDIVALSPGGGCYAACLTPQGRMIADMHVFADRDRLLLDVAGGVADRLRERFDDLVFTEDVRIEDLTADRVTCGLHGPEAHRVAAALSGAVGPLAVCEHRPLQVGAAPGLIARTDDLGIEGYRVVVERPAAEALRRGLAAAGAVAVEPAALETVRVESGRPVFPIDMDRDTIPLEAGITDRAVSFDKGCYVGQEVIIRVLHRGQGRVARRLAGLVFERSADPGAPLPSRGAAIFSGDDEVGRVTSAARSPAVGAVIALGYLRRDLAEAGRGGVEVSIGTDRAPAAIAALPFVPAGDPT